MKSDRTADLIGITILLYFLINAISHNIGIAIVTASIIIALAIWRKQ